MYLLKADTVDCCEMFIFLTELIRVVTRHWIDKPICLNVAVNQHEILSFKIKLQGSNKNIKCIVLHFPYASQPSNPWETIPTEEKMWQESHAVTDKGHGIIFKSYYF